MKKLAVSVATAPRSEGAADTAWGEPVVATGPTVTLTDTTLLTGNAFYKVVVSVP